MRTRVKICGITRLEDAETAVLAGADALGFVFYSPSPRAIDVQTMSSICEELPTYVTPVALMVNAEVDFISQLLDAVPHAVLQFHGDESPEYCQQFEHAYYKAIRMKDGVDLLTESNNYSRAQNLLLDAYQKGLPGGTGEQFNWDNIPAELCSKIILAGGLSSDNVGLAIKNVRPYAVDVSGGVEQAPGIKCPIKIKQFFTQVYLADNQLRACE